ncbi:MAG: SpoIIE family protein phosphatase [Actinobacteria bacterium]|nr:SpoIIE family protein phosphatase [Actinomycetota bacterium]
MRRRSLPRDPTAAALARRAVEADAAALSAEQLDLARLLVSELVTNAVRHGAGEQVVLASSIDDARARFEVHDAGTQRPALRAPRGAAGGYGLNLVETLASRWGADGDAGVWFELDLPQNGAAAPPAAAVHDRPPIDAAVARQLGTVLDGLAEAVTVSDEQGRTVYANDAAVRLLRLTAEERERGAAGRELMERFDVYDEHGEPVAIEALPGSRVRAGEHDAAPMLVRNVVKATGEERWLLNKTTALRDENGRVTGVVNVIEDVTEAKRAEFAQRLLARASDVLASSLDYEATVQRVAEVAVPVLADWCGVDVPGPDGYAKLVALVHRDPQLVALARRMRARYPVPLDRTDGIATVMRGASHFVRADVGEEELRAYAQDEEHFEMLRELGMASVVVVPLAAGGQKLGTLILARSTRGRPFDDADVALAEELGRRAGTAMLNARAYTERAAIAATLQRGLRPPELLAPAGFVVATHYDAAGAFNEVGGDFYDAFTTAAGWMLVIGDVAGHGAEAAALTALARWTLRTTSQLTRDPTRAARQLNATLRDLPQLSLCTAVCAHVRADGDTMDEVTVTLANCGHPRPLLVRRGRIEEVGEVGPMAGAFDDGEWPSAEVTLQPGDTLLLYTDGVLDTVGTRERFGEQRLRAALEAAAHAEQPSALVARLAGALETFRDGPQRDDTAIVALRFTGVPAGAYEAAATGT